MGAAVSFIVTAPTAEVKVKVPDWNADMPNPSCSISGNRKGIAPTETRNIKPPTSERRKLAWRSSDRSMIGCAARLAWRRYSASKAAPAAIIASATQTLPWWLPSSVKPKIASDRPRPVSKKPGQSKGRSVSARTWGTSHSASASPISPTGTLSQKMPRQW